jgi:hypothetical protein
MTPQQMMQARQMQMAQLAASNPLLAEAIPDLADQGLINAMYDIFGSYPRANVLPYFYAFQLTNAQGDALAANATGRASIKVSADAAFVATLITGTSTGSYLNLARTDSSDRQLMGQAVHSAASVGTAERPLKLPKPLLLAPNTTISFDLTNLTGAANEIYYTLVGFKVYRRQYASAG